MEYNHKSNQLDPRDTLVTYSVETKQFIVDASDLNANNISPWSKDFKWCLFLWSEKYKTSILYIQDRIIENEDGDVIADVFIPANSNYPETKGTELHIIND